MIGAAGNTRALFIIIAGCLAASAAVAVELKLVQAEPPEVYASGESAILSFPLQPEGVPEQGLERSADEVLLGDQQRNDLAQYFKAVLIPKGDPRGPRIDLTVPLDLASTPGTYSVLIRFRDAKNAELAVARLKLSHPEAQVRQPGTLVIENVWGWRESHAKLLVREVGHRSQLSRLSVRQTEPMQGAPRGELKATLKDDQRRVPPAGALEVAVEPAGEFPVGTVKGNLELDAAELKAPVLVPVEVRTRCARWALVIALMVGLMFSYVVRDRLRKRLDLTAARALASEAWERAGRERSSHPDKKFRDRIDAKMKTLETSLTAPGGGDPKTISDDSKALVAEIAAALTDLEQRRVDVQGKIQEALGVLLRGWSLPPAVAQTVQFEVYHLSKLREQAQVDPDDASTALKNERPSLEQAISEAAAGYRGMIKARAQELFAPEGKLARVIGLQSLELLQAIEKIARVSPGTEIAPLLEQVHEARVRLADAIAPVPVLLAGLTEKLAGLAAAAGAGDHAAKIKSAAEGARALGDPEHSLETIEAALSALHAAVSSAIDALQTRVPREAIDAARQALDERDYSAALSSLVPGSQEPKAQRTRPIAADFAPEAQLAGPARTVVNVTSPVSAPSTQIPFVPVKRAQSPDVETVLGVSVQERKSALWYQTVVSGIALTIVGYMIFGDAFTGALKDFAAAAAWAFSVDLTIDGLVTAASALRK